MLDYHITVHDRERKRECNTMLYLLAQYDDQPSMMTALMTIIHTYTHTLHTYIHTADRCMDALKARPSLHV